MKNDVKLLAKVYIRNGIVIEEEVVFDKNNNREIVDNYIDEVGYNIKNNFQKDCNFCLTFGNTIFRGEDISAITLTTVEVE